MVQLCCGGTCGSWDAEQPHDLFFKFSLTLRTRCHQLGSYQSIAYGAENNGRERHGAIQPVQEVYIGRVKEG